MESSFEWLVDHLKNTGKIDNIDGIILQRLLSNSREPIRSIADEADVSRPTVYDRINRLEDSLIDGYTTQINYNKAGLPITAFILVSYDTQAQSLEDSKKGQKQVASEISLIEFVKRVHIVTGSYDFLVEIAIDHMGTLADTIIEKIGEIRGVGNTVTNVSFAAYQNGKQINKFEK